jgi:hypothetical protein
MTLSCAGLDSVGSADAGVVAEFGVESSGEVGGVVSAIWDGAALDSVGPTAWDGPAFDGSPPALALGRVAAGTPNDAGSLINQAVVEAITTTSAASAKTTTRRRLRSGVDAADPSFAAPTTRPRFDVRSGALASWPKKLAAVGRTAGSSANAFSRTSMNPGLTPGIGVIGPASSAGGDGPLGAGPTGRGGRPASSAYSVAARE